MAAQSSHSTDPAAPIPIIGSSIGPYRVVRKLGVGGMGAVYEAVHKQIGRRAAIKLLHAQFAVQKDIVSRFLNEARAANLVRHPGIVDIYEFGQTPAGNAYIVMEYIDGVSLSTKMAKASAPLGLSALPLFQKMAQALAAAHEKGIVHRDLKPDNVMLAVDAEAPGGERIKILDFGIAKLSEQALAAGGHDQDDAEAESAQTEFKTRTGAMLGTPAYMSPEQCRGAERVTDRTDVYALGLMLYRALTGDPALVGRSDLEYLLLHTSTQPADLREKYGIDDGLATLVHAMLAKEPEQRPSMAEVATELGLLSGRLLHGVAGDSSQGVSQSGASASWRTALAKGSSLAPDPAAVPVPRPLSRAVLGLVVGGSALAGLLFVALFATSHKRPARGSLAGVALPAPVVSPAKAGEPVVPPRSPSPAALAPAALAPAQVHWEITTTPKGALVISAESNDVLGVTPWRHEREAAAGPFKVLLRLAAFQDTPLTLDRGRDAVVQLVLPPAEPPRPGRTPGRGRPAKTQPVSSAKNLTNEDLPVVE